MEEATVPLLNLVKGIMLVGVQAAAMAGEWSPNTGQAAELDFGCVVTEEADGAFRAILDLEECVNDVIPFLQAL